MKLSVEGLIDFHLIHRHLQFDVYIKYPECYRLNEIYSKQIDV